MLAYCAKEKGFGDRMSLVTKLTNNSDENINVKLTAGGSLNIPPGCVMNDVDVANLAEIRDKVTVKENLTEVGTPPGKTRIDG